MAETAKWPKNQWASFYRPYLLGEALSALKSLEKQEAADYKTLKQAILDRYSITPETYRQWLWAPGLPEGTRSWAIITTLKDAATQWLRPTTYDGKRIVKLVVIEQLLILLPPRTCHWLACWSLEHLPDFLKLWGNFVAADEWKTPRRGDGGRGPHPERPGRVGADNNPNVRGWGRSGPPEGGPVLNRAPQYPSHKGS